MLLSNPVFLCLQTSEPGGNGQILRVAAERPAEERGRHPRRFERLARPTASVTMAQRQALGLTKKQLDSAPELDAVLEDLLDFSSGAEVWLVPDGAAARTALAFAAAQAGFHRGFGPQVLGADELGQVVKPHLVRQGIKELLAHYAVAAETGPPGLAGPAAVCEVWTRLEADLAALPLPLLAEMNWLLARTSHPLKELLKSAEKQALSAQFPETFRSGKLGFQDLFRDHSDLLAGLPTREEAETEVAPGELSEPLRAEEAAELLGPNGPLAKALPGYEHRREQLELAKRAADALNSGRHLIAEAGTGVGKSLAYLAPAALFSRRAGRPVMLSTHTKNLQSQLFDKDLPLLKQATGLDFRAALLKGRGNYLCLRKLVYLLQEAAHELEDDDRAELLPILPWAVQTPDGDVAGLAAFTPETAPELWERLSTTGEDCFSRQCRFFPNCFVYRARALAHRADLVVLNHALVFAELNQDNGTLPRYHEIVFDEAHTLEEVATEHLACEVTPRRAYRILNRLFRAPPGGVAGKGLLPSLLFQLESSRKDFASALFQSIQEHALSAIQAIAPAETGVGRYFEAVRGWHESAPGSEEEGPVPAHVPRERGIARRRAGGEQGPEEAADAPPPAASFSRSRPRPAQGEARRFTANAWRPDEAERLGAGKEAFISGLGRLRQALDAVLEDFAELNKRHVPRARELKKELNAQQTRLQELIGDIEFVMKADEPNYVYWAEPLGRKALRVVAAPLDLSGILHSQLYEKKRACLLVSATLSIRDAGADEGSGFAPLASARAFRRPAPVEAEDLSPPPGLGWEDFPRAKPAPHRKAFEFLKQRLGLSLCAEEQLDELLEGSPFDYLRQCRLYVPLHLPEPGGAREREFQEGLAALIAQLAVASEGRALALYTSYEVLRKNARALRKTLSPEGLEVLAQGEDGGREALLARLKAGGRVVLLGTTSFWEGVDVPGEALSLLVIAKLPFPVPGDPLVAGRCELLEQQGKDAFLNYSVPMAILRLRQGFGRLIRTKSDRGVVVLCDKRVLTRRYGPAFLRSLPVPARRAGEPARLAAEVREFLAERASE